MLLVPEADVVLVGSRIGRTSLVKTHNLKQFRLPKLSRLPNNCLPQIWKAEDVSVVVDYVMLDDSVGYHDSIYLLALSVRFEGTQGSTATHPCDINAHSSMCTHLRAWRR